AVRDLHHVAAIERLLAAMPRRGYVSPARLADARVFQAMKMQPLLPDHFLHAERQGYRFEFTGDKAVPAAGPFAPLGAAYESFVYAAVPQAPGPPARRAFALYPGGQIFATTERRVPTQADSPLDAR